MLPVCAFLCGLLMLGACAPQHPSGQELIPAKEHPRTGTSSDAAHIHPHAANDPCSGGSHGYGEILEDVFALLREGWGKESDPRRDYLSRFGVCSNANDSQWAAFTELAVTAHRPGRNGMKVLQPNKEWFADEEEGGLVLTLDSPHNPVLTVKPILLLAFDNPLRAGNLVITITSEALEPNTQTMCISETTQYIVLTVKTSESNRSERWALSIKAKSPGPTLQEVFIARGAGVNISMTPLMIFPSDTATDVRSTHVSGHSSAASSQTYPFLCELQDFLSDVLPQNFPQTTPVQLDFLQSSPPLTLGLSSSETLLERLLNSSATTIFFFPRQRSLFQAHHGQLSLSPVLVELLQQRLEEAVSQIREEDVGHRGIQRLARLKAWISFPSEQDQPADLGHLRETQYRAFLLLKALQTVVRAFEVKRAQRAARGGQEGSGRGHQCRLHSLTVSLEKYLVGPTTANINNCHGTCGFPLTSEMPLVNHAALLNSHVQSGRSLQRSLCCVPVDYEGLDVAELNEEGTKISTKPNMVATQCGCR